MNENMTNMISNYYDGKSILITGVTGFLGKTLLEKILYSCSAVENVYVLIRVKDNLTIEDRLKTLLEQPVFVRLRKLKQHMFEKIKPISGDISLFDLGISWSDKEILLNEVSVVFHLAATIKFNEPLDVTLNINTGGTERILNLCKRMRNIHKFVYVSTSYSNCERNVIEEEIYPVPITYEELKKRLIIGMKDSEIKELMNGKPNTYTFSKALAEDYINRNHGNVPTIIVRPSIVTPSLAEPMEGWIDSWVGPSGLIVAIGVGLNRVMLAKPTNVLDIIPVDYVTNLTIVAAATSNMTSEVLVYNSCTSELNPSTLETIFEYIKKYHLENKYYYYAKPSIVLTMSKSRVYFKTIFEQIIPAHVLDFGLSSKGKDRRYVKMLDKVLNIRKVMEPFSSNSWLIRSQRIGALSASLSEYDKAEFPFNPVDLDWSVYIPIYCQGIKTYLMNKSS